MVHSIHSIPHQFAGLCGALSPPPTRADGRKRWIIIPPERWDIVETNNANIHLWLKPKYHQIQEKHPGLFWEFIQEPGEILYIPNGWGYGILNIEPTIIGLSLGFRCSLVWRATASPRPSGR